MMEIKLHSRVGDFAENKDIAKEIRVKEIMPNIKNKTDVVLDFEEIDSATQSFIHALISDVIREFGVEALDNLKFKNCNDTIKKIVNIVCEYMQTDHY